MPVLDLSVYKPVPGTLEDANQIANGFTAVQTCINALDNNNFAAGKIFDPTKIMQNAAVDGDAMVWDNTNLKWVPASAMPATSIKPGLYKIWDSVDAGVTLPAASISTPTLPQTFKHLRIEIVARSASLDDFVVVRFNGDTGPNYDSEATKVAGTALSGIEAVGGTGARCATATASTAPAGEAGIGSFVIPGYADATKRKTLIGQSFYKLADTTTSFNLFTHGAGWRNTAVLTTMTFLLLGGQNLVAPCRITVYGEA